MPLTLMEIADEALRLLQSYPNIPDLDRPSTRPGSSNFVVVSTPDNRLHLRVAVELEGDYALMIDVFRIGGGRVWAKFLVGTTDFDRPLDVFSQRWIKPSICAIANRLGREPVEHPKPTVTGRMVVVSPEALTALLTVEGAKFGEPVLTDGEGRYFPTPAEHTVRIAG